MIKEKRSTAAGRLALGALVAVLTLAAAACDLLQLPEDPADVGPQYAGNVTVVDSTISTAVTWTEGNVYYIDGIVRLKNGATVSIEPGAIIKFSASGELYIEAGAVVTANGTALKPIVFTSIREDASGGDSILNDGSTPPAKGDWYGIEVEAGSTGSQFSNCLFCYGGKSKYATLLINGAATVNQCVFRDNLGGHPYNGVDSATLDASFAADGTGITGNTFYRNDWPLAITATMGIDASNAFSFDDDSDPETADATNAQQGIYVMSGDIATPVSWTETEVPLCFFGQLVRVKSTGTLTIASGAVLKNSTSEFQFEYGSTVSWSGAIFTSFRDDSLGGDTNGDGTASGPTKGDWVGIEILTADTFYYLSSTDVRYPQNP